MNDNLGYTFQFPRYVCISQDLSPPWYKKYKYQLVMMEMDNWGKLVDANGHEKVANPPNKQTSKNKKIEG